MCCKYLGHVLTVQSTQHHSSVLILTFVQTFSENKAYRCTPRQWPAAGHRWGLPMTAAVMTRSWHDHWAVLLRHCRRRSRLRVTYPAFKHTPVVLWKFPGWQQFFRPGHLGSGSGSCSPGRAGSRHRSRNMGTPPSGIRYSWSRPSRLGNASSHHSAAARC